MVWPMPNDASLTTEPVRVWDLPTRVFHVLLALGVIALVVTGHIGGNAMIWHTRLGLAVGALLLFRLIWGFAGGRWSRFSNFGCSPSSIQRFVRGTPAPDDHFDIGHSPLGSLSVFTMLALLVVQVGTGLIADDEIATTGPLNRFVSNATASAASEWHGDIGQWLIIGLVALHLGAIAWYTRIRRQDLLGPMWHGDKRLAPGTPGSADTPATRLAAVLLAAACAALAVWVDQLG